MKEPTKPPTELHLTRQRLSRVGPALSAFDQAMVQTTRLATELDNVRFACTGLNVVAGTRITTAIGLLLEAARDDFIADFHAWEREERKRDAERTP
jgi:hypothetical protein